MDGLEDDPFWLVVLRIDHFTPNLGEMIQFDYSNILFKGVETTNWLSFRGKTV